MSPSRSIAQPCRILVVESDSPVRQLIAILLGSAGHTVTQAASREEATAHLAAAAFDVVITDSFGRRPDDVIASVQGVIQAAAPIPVLVCTGHRIPFGDL